MIGPTELLAILLAALFLFGPAKLPELARSLGGAVGEFKKAQRAAELELTTFDPYTRKNVYGATAGAKEGATERETEDLNTKTGADRSLKNSLEARSSIPEKENSKTSGAN
ncbi:Twin-arginine translocation protein TatA [Methanosarcina siciliae C2J]|uniref:Twin-arginine translocation protein TatA n=3 Tax=Methanosarcina siciliae TaxID=38027 RepID=A0A0E3PG31_9EURY|nr:twin-arginine translocase TatA/TatE family subunit [Methanosarcina siciliae]AKB29465.1 Twin-arginine translocation protein TatA [Methanosarcina siciliae T4/M]AKB33400.1 Twin-arginine translocation protein TatA [Methanosarcina siciliae HI350]AKB37655.1 Twin-arginine translocation protein TatA [Methanosarcina siciliae C2J]